VIRSFWSIWVRNQRPATVRRCRGAGLADGRLHIDLKAEEPDPGAMMAQVITTPCVALRIPPALDAGELVVSMDAEGFPLSLRIPD